MATIQTRLTSDNKQHDEAFKKSKQQVYNYNKQVDQSKASILKFAKGGLGALSAAVGVAGGAMAVFNKTIRATQTTSDAFDITVNAMKASVDSFFVALSTGNFKTFLDGLNDIVEASKEVSKNLDELGTKQIFLDRSTADYNKLKAEQNKIIYDKNSTKEEVEAAKATLREATKKYRKEQEALAQEALETAASMLQAAFKDTGAKVSNDTINKIVGDIDLYKAWGKKYLDYEAQIRQFGINKGNAFDGSGKAYWQSRIDEIKNSNEYKIANAVYNTSDKKLKEANGHYINARNIQTQMIIDDTNQMKLEQRVDKRFNNSTNSTSTTPTPKTIAEILEWEEENPIEDFKFNDEAVNNLISNLNTLAEVLEDKLIPIDVDSWIGDIEKKEWDLAKSTEDANKKLEKQKNILDLQSDTISSLSSAFGTLGDSFDISGLKIASIIGEAIANILKGYSEASAKQAAGSITGWDWLAFSVAGLAQVASVIGQIHSLSGYAEGGIIGGNSYTGDKVLARVNSGEMILNPSQQANLFNMINGGVSTGGEVKFRIEGSTLIGVLNNYNKKVRRVM